MTQIIGFGKSRYIGEHPRGASEHRSEHPEAIICVLFSYQTQKLLWNELDGGSTAPQSHRFREIASVFGICDDLSSHEMMSRRSKGTIRFNMNHIMNKSPAGGSDWPQLG